MLTINLASKISSWCIALQCRLRSRARCRASRLYLDWITDTGYTYGALVAPIALLLGMYFAGLAVILGAAAQRGGRGRLARPAA